MAVATVSQEKYNQMVASGQPIPIGLQVEGGAPAAPAATAAKVDPNTVDPVYKNAVIAMAMQKRMQEEAAAMAAQAKAEQERLAAEKKAFEERAAAQAEKTRTETEGFQRTGAEREVARKKAARSTVARPLLAAATASGGPQTLGYGGGMSAGGSLGTTQTLGVG